VEASSKQLKACGLIRRTRDIVFVRLEKSLQRSLGDRSSAITETRGKMRILGTATTELSMELNRVSRLK
jgi:hypothetical protein